MSNKETFKFTEKILKSCDKCLRWMTTANLYLTFKNIIQQYIPNFNTKKISSQLWKYMEIVKTIINKNKVYLKQQR